MDSRLFYFYTIGMPKKESKASITQQLDKLDKLIRWFDEQEQVDIQEGLVRVKEGTELIKDIKSRLKAVENEFEELKKDLESDTNNL